MASEAVCVRPRSSNNIVPLQHVHRWRALCAAVHQRRLHVVLGERTQKKSLFVGTSWGVSCHPPWFSTRDKTIDCRAHFHSWRPPSVWLLSWSLNPTSDCFQTLSGRRWARCLIILMSFDTLLYILISYGLLLSITLLTRVCRSLSTWFIKQVLLTNIINMVFWPRLGKKTL